MSSSPALLTRADILLACRIRKLDDRAGDDRLPLAERQAYAAKARRLARGYRYGHLLRLCDPAAIPGTR